MLVPDEDVSVDYNLHVFMLPLNTNILWHSLFAAPETNLTLSHTPAALLAYADTFAADTLNRLVATEGVLSDWTISGGALTCSSALEMEDIARLKDYLFENTGTGGKANIKAKVKIGATAAVVREAGLVFAEDQGLCYHADLILAADGSETLGLYKRVILSDEEYGEGVYGDTHYGGLSDTALDTDTSITALAGTYYWIDIDWSSAGIDVYFYAVGAARPGTPILTTADATYMRGYTGARGATGTSGTGNLNVSFDDFSVTANETHTRGVLTTTIVDDANQTTQNEYSMLAGDAAALVWNARKGVVDCQSATVTKQVNVLKSLDFDTDNIAVDIEINSIAAVDRFAGIVFDVLDSTHYYYACAGLTAAGTATLRFNKYGGTATNYTTGISIPLYEKYRVEVVHTGSTINVYGYLASGTRPVSPQISITDATYTHGYTGMYAEVSAAAAGNMDVSFSRLIIKSQEYDAIDGSYLCIPSVAHGGLHDADVKATLAWTAGTDIPAGKFTTFVREKATVVTPGIEHHLVYGLGISIEHPTLTSTDVNQGTDWTHTDELLSYTAGAQTLYIERHLDTAPTDPIVLIDAFGLLPITGISGGGLMPHDLAFASLCEPSVLRRTELKV